MLKQALLPALREAPQAEEGLKEVVGDDDMLDLVRITVLHEPECQGEKIISTQALKNISNLDTDVMRNCGRTICIQARHLTL